MDIKAKINKITSEIVEFIRGRKKRDLYCIVGGLILGMFSLIINRGSIYIRPYEIERGIYGTQKVSKIINIDVENLEKNMEFNIGISPRQYTKSEADKKFSEIFEKIKVSILGENLDYEHINKKLNFITDFGEGIKAIYNFEPYYENISSESDTSQFNYYVKYQNLVDGQGNISNENFTENEQCNGYIEVQLSTDIKEQENVYKSEKMFLPVTVVSQDLSEIEKFKIDFKNEINKKDNESINEDTIKLPKSVNNYRIRYNEKLDFTFLLMPFLGILMTILLEVRDREKVKEIEKKKIRMLELDFSQIVSKILLYVNSGMTVRNSIIRMATEYQNKLRHDKQIKRMAYEELIIVKNKLNGGYSEIKAYEEMAKNINIRIYTRFLNIIIQSIKNGNKELKNILNMEVQDALYERKQKAKKLGEEATTKLILPLMMMLAIIMVVIMVPAFMGM